MTDAGRTRRTWLAARLDRTSYLGLHLTLGLLAIAATLWAFGALLEEILEDAALVRWDTAQSLRVHLAATPNGMRVAQWISNVGSPMAMGAIALVGVLVLWRRHRLLAVTWIAAVAGGSLVDVLMKLAVHRARPPYARAYLHIDSFSFPSGHAMAATIGLGMFAYAIHQTRGRRAAFVAWPIAALLALTVAASRVYLGVHYPTDVLGGSIGGAAWLAICLTGASVARRRRADSVTPTA